MTEQPPTPAPLWQIEPQHLETAQAVCARFALRSPLIPAPWLGSNVWLKLEAALPTGSFKVRGALTALTALSETERGLGVVAASAGNHGLGLGFAGRELGIAITVYVPAGTADVKLDGMRALGVQIHVSEEKSYDLVETQARDAAEKSGAVFVSPFDDPYVAAGNGGAVGLEILDAMPGVERIVVPVGGGGLLCGIAAAVAQRRSKVQLIGVESEVSDAMRRSLESGITCETLEATGPTLAEGLEGGVSPTTHALTLQADVRMAVVTEEEIALAMVSASKRLTRPIEGSAAATLAWIRRLENQSDVSTVIVVSGGNVDAQRLTALAGGWRPRQVSAAPSSEEE